MSINNVKRFKCQICGNEFLSDRSREDAIAEKEELFGDVPLKECVVVCDNCFKRAMEIIKN